MELHNATPLVGQICLNVLIYSDLVLYFFMPFVNRLKCISFSLNFGKEVLKCNGNNIFIICLKKNILPGKRPGG
jgi:hypothetical protein